MKHLTKIFQASQHNFSTAGNLSVKFYFILGLYIFSIGTVEAQKKELDSLAYNKLFPQLENALHTSRISSIERTAYEALLDNAYNRPLKSDARIKTLSPAAWNKLSRRLQYQLARARYDNAVQPGNYKSAALRSAGLIEKYQMMMDSAELADQKDETAIYTALAMTPVQSVSIKQPSRIKIKRDPAGLINIPVTIGGTTVLFVFDTGAGFSTITDSYARKLKIDLLPGFSTIIKGGLNGIGTEAKLGIARQLSIGNIRLNNVLFLVIPDSALTFAGGAYKINGIIGLPVIKGFGQFTLSAESLTVPLAGNTAQSPHNLALDQLTPVIYMKFKGQDLPFTFDTGADATLFSLTFYKRFQAETGAGTDSRSMGLGGAGGTKKIKSLKSGKLNFTFAGQTAVFNDADISLDTEGLNKAYYYGNVGLDLLNQFRTVTIDFNNASITVTK